MALNYKGYEQKTAAGSAVTLTVPAGANRCYMEVTAFPIYYTLDATTPASDNGGVANAGDVIDLMGYGHHSMNSVMAGIKLIRKSSAGSGIINVHYFD
jgi:hypothetical protein